MQPNGEQIQIVDVWSHGGRAAIRQASVHGLFEEQVRLRPSHVALLCEGESLTYQALHEASNQLARLIKRHYAGELSKDTLIVVCLERSIEVLIGILGVLKSGGAYVPIDSSYPLERINYIIEDTQTQCILTERKLGGGFKDAIYLEERPYLNESSDDLDNDVSPADLAYVIYTSGTTGRPKGVMIEHGSVVNYHQNVLPYFEGIERIDFSTSLAFDLSVTTTLLPLMSGKSIVIYKGQLVDIELYVEHLKRSSIDFIKSTPTHLSTLWSYFNEKAIKRCFVGGEKLEPRALEQISHYVEEI
jgi:non-ribosomal peptide synthetase component F